MVTAIAPGKLFIAGEYAVTHPEQPAIIVAVNKLIKVTITESKIGMIESNKYKTPLFWQRNEKGNIKNDLVLSTIDVTERYISEQRNSLKYFHLSISSELDDTAGTKYGLGSSGAVCVATIKALFLFYGLPLDKEKIFKLGVLAQLSIGKIGSFGDLASSTYGGWIVYQTIDLEWLINMNEKLTLTKLVDHKWPRLFIEPLIPPKELKLLVAWSGSPAITENLVKDVKNNIDQSFYQSFLYESKLCVLKMKEAFKANNLTEIQTQIRINRSLLMRLSQKSGIWIETDKLTKLCEIAEKFGGAAKSSGAGGGDCGIVIINQKKQLELLIDAWEQQGIIYLPLDVYEDDEMS